MKMSPLIFQPRSVLWEYLWHFKLTVPGKLLIAAGILSGLLGSSSMNIPIYVTFCALFFVGLAALLVNSLHRPRLRLSGQVPDKAVAGQPLRFDIKVTNYGRLPAYDIGVAFIALPRGIEARNTDTFAAAIPAGGSATLSVELLPLRRGGYSLPPLRAFTTFPFNILRSGSSKLEAGVLVVQPAFHPLSEAEVPVRRCYQPGGVALTSNIGESPEYIGNREYRAGDPLRHIDFRSWARLAKPAVREYQEEYYCRLALVLDTYVPPMRWPSVRGFADLEAGISLAAATAHALSHGEYLIDIFAAGPELYVFRAGRHTAHLENILEILACVGPCRANPFDKVAPALAEQLHSTSTVVCILLGWDEARARIVRAAEEAGCETKVIIVGDKAVDTLGHAEQPMGHVAPRAVLAGEVDVL